jgi:hypothetical protein
MENTVSRRMIVKTAVFCGVAALAACARGYPEAAPGDALTGLYGDGRAYRALREQRVIEVMEGGQAQPQAPVFCPLDGEAAARRRAAEAEWKAIEIAPDSQPLPSSDPDE